MSGISESEHNTLLNQYNRLVARFRELAKQSEERQEKWRQLEKDYKTNEALSRELCELILAKDPNEMVLGREYSWGKLPFRELIQRTKISFEKYNEERTKLLQDIQAVSEERRSTIESLETQLSQIMHREKNLDDTTNPLKNESYDNESGEIYELPKEQSTSHITEPHVPEQTLKRVPYNTQQAAKNGAIDVVILEEDSDISTQDIAQQEEMARISTAISIEQTGYRISPAEQKRKAAEQARQMQERNMLIDANQTKDRLNPRCWFVIKIIGETGLCEGSAIIEYANKHWNEYFEQDDQNNKYSDSAVKGALKKLTDTGCVIIDTDVKHPLKPRFAVYYLSDIGERFFKEKFEKDPVLSERNILIAQHDNLEHAFGIKSLKEILERSGKYDKVSMDRKNNTIILDGSVKFIPDIKATGIASKSKRPFAAYFEYERGTHSQTDFNIKLTRMSKVTRFINIVCGNTITVEKLVNETKKWIESRGGHTHLSNIRVRITTLTRLNGQSDIDSDDSWQAIFNLRHSSEPIIH